MEIPPEERDSARAFVMTAYEVRSAERRARRHDRIALGALFVGVAFNAYVATGAGVAGILSMVVVVALSFVAGMKFVVASERRETFRNIDAAANQAETALAFYDLDDAS